MAEALKSHDFDTVNPSQDAMDEPSMEDILASIRGIIEEDERSRKVESDRSLFEYPSDVSNLNEETLVEQLTQQLDAPDQSEVSAASTDTDFETLVFEGQATAPVLRKEQTSSAAAHPAGHPAGHPASPFRLPHGGSGARPETPVSASARIASSAAATSKPVAARSEAAEPFAQKAPSLPKLDDAGIAADIAAKWLKSHEGELRTLAEEAARPLIQKWLAENLSALVERLIQQEIEAASRRHARG